MSGFDALVRGGRVVLPELEEPVEVDVAIAGGRVAALLERGAAADAERIWDAEDKLVFPGAIDPHVHVSWPYLDNRTSDDYSSATRAAAAGGTTSIIDFAIEGRESPIAALAHRRSQAEGRAVIDFSFHLVVSAATKQVLDEMESVVDGGVTSFKLYMTYRRRGLAISDGDFYKVARRAAELGAVIGVHAENADLDDLRTAELRANGLGAAHYLPEAKPPFVEAEAIARAARISAAAGSNLWILHLSSPQGLRAARDARAACGQPAALETCPQYVFLDRTRLEGDNGQRFLCSPPLRAPDECDQIWAAVLEGSFDWLGTDHCLFLAEQKDSRRDAFWDCPHGLPGIQTRPMLVLARATRAGLPLTRTASLLSAGAARWFGLYPRKGTLLPGSDADLAIWDPNDHWTVTQAGLEIGDWTPYEGHEAWAPPDLVLVRGEPVVESGAMVAPEGYGRFLARPYTLERFQHAG